MFVFSGCCSSDNKSLFFQKQNGHEADPSTVARLCLSLIHDEWPSVRVVFLLENSLARLPASFVSAESKADHVCLDASSFCPVEHLRSFCYSSPVPWSWECNSTFSREGRFLHLPHTVCFAHLQLIISCSACQIPFQFSQAQCCRAEDSCNPALHVENPFVLVYGHRSQACGRRFAQSACHVEEFQLHKEVITPPVVLCSTRSRDIVYSLVDRRDLYNNCQYNYVHAAGTKMQSTRSQPGFVMRASHPHPARMILTLSFADTWNGSDAKELPIVLAQETLLPSCVGIAPHMEEKRASFAGSSAHWSDCFCSECNCSCMEFNRSGPAHCHLLRRIFADDGRGHLTKIANHSTQLLCSFNPTDHEDR